MANNSNTNNLFISGFLIGGMLAIASAAGAYAPPADRDGDTPRPPANESSLILVQEETEESEGKPAQFDPEDTSLESGKCLIAEDNKCPDGTYKCVLSDGTKSCDKCPPIGGYTIPQRLIEQEIAQSQDPVVPPGDPDRTGNAGSRYAPPQRRA